MALRLNEFLHLTNGRFDTKFSTTFNMHMGQPQDVETLNDYLSGGALALLLVHWTKLNNTMTPKRIKGATAVWFWQCCTAFV